MERKDIERLLKRKKISGQAAGQAYLENLSCTISRDFQKKGVKSVVDNFELETIDSKMQYQSEHEQEIYAEYRKVFYCVNNLYAYIYPYSVMLENALKGLKRCVWTIAQKAIENTGTPLIMKLEEYQEAREEARRQAKNKRISIKEAALFLIPAPWDDKTPIEKKAVDSYQAETELLEEIIARHDTGHREDARKELKAYYPAIYGRLKGLLDKADQGGRNWKDKIITRKKAAATIPGLEDIETPGAWEIAQAAGYSGIDLYKAINAGIAIKTEDTPAKQAKEELESYVDIFREIKEEIEYHYQEIEAYTKILYSYNAVIEVIGQLWESPDIAKNAFYDMTQYNIPDFKKLRMTVCSKPDIIKGEKEIAKAFPKIDFRLYMVPEDVKQEFKDNIGKNTMALNMFLESPCDSVQLMSYSY